MSGPRSVAIVGAGPAGLSIAEALRRKGFQGTLTLVGAEPHLPYDRPPLSKQVLGGAWEPARAQLRSAAALSALEAEIILAEPATGLDVEPRIVHTAAGRAIRADAIVVATGVRHRSLPGSDGLSGVHVLRTLDDTVALRAELLTASRLLVVGDGVLGAEIAATARGMGVAVIMAGPQPAPMAAQVGPFASAMLADLHISHGVELRLGTAVEELTSTDGRVTGARLSGGEVLPADVVAIAIGSDPATGWLADSGLHLDDGLVCDAYCQAAPGIYAAGDVARWHHPGLGTSVRLENRTNATEQAGAVADAILGQIRPYTPVPYFWTDQFQIKLQVHGILTADAEVSVVEGDPGTGRFVALHRTGGRATGVLGWNMPKQTRLRRQDVAPAFTGLAPVAHLEEK